MPFVKGQSGNPGGRPKKFKIKDYLSQDDVDALVKKAQELAMQGKTDMIKLLIEHSFGKPVQKHAGIDEEDGFNPLIVKIIHGTEKTNNNENTC